MTKPWKKRLIVAASILAVLLIVTLIIVLNPSFQKSIFVSQLEKHFDEVRVEHIGIGLFSGEIKELYLATDDFAITLNSGTAKYSPFGILLMHVNVDTCDVSGLEIDIKQWPEAKEEDPEAVKEPFPGLLDLCDTGFKFSLGELSLDAKAKVPGFESEVELKGNGLAPGETGNFQLARLILSRLGQEDLKRVGVTGNLTVGEGGSGAVEKLGWDIEVTAEGSIFDEEAKLLIGGGLSRGEEREDEKGDAIPAIETLTVAIKEVLSTPQDSDLLNLNAQYDGASADFSGDFQVSADNDTLSPFAIALDLPLFSGEGDGKLEWNLDSMTGESSMTMNTSITEVERLSSVLASVGDLNIKEKHRITATLDELSIESFSLQIDRPDGEEVVALAISRPLVFRRVETDQELGDFEKPWLSIKVGIPLEWFDPVLGGFELEGADLEGNLNFAGSPFKQLSVTVDESLKVTGASIARDGEILLGNVSMLMTPEAQLSTKLSTFTLDKLSISAKKSELLTGDFKATFDIGDGDGFIATADGGVEVYVRGLVAKTLNQDQDDDQSTEANLAARQRIKKMSDALGPSSLKATFSGSAKPEVVTAESFRAAIAKTDQPPLLEAVLSDPVQAKFSPEGVDFIGLDNEWFSAVIDGLPVNLVAIFVDGFDLSGDTIKGKLTMGAGESSGSFVLSFTEPLTVTQINLAKDDQVLLEAVDLQVVPSIKYTPGKANIKADSFSAKSVDGVLASGSLTAEATLDQLSVSEVSFDLEGASSLNAVLAQPVATPYLKTKLGKPVDGSLKLSGKTDLKSVALSDLSAGLKANGSDEILSFQTTKPLQVKDFALSDLETILNQVELEATTSLSAFPLWLPLAFVETAPATVSSGNLNGTVNLTVGQGSAKVAGNDAFQLKDLNVALSEVPAIKQVSVTLIPSLMLNPTEAIVEARDIQVMVEGSNAQPIKGGLATEVEWLEPMPVKSLSIDLAGDVAPWLKQPAVPRNGVSGGQFTFATVLKEDRNGTVDAKLTDLAFHGDKPLLTAATVEGTIQVDVDKRTYTGQLPVIIETKSGVTDFDTDFSYQHLEARDKLIADIKSQLIHLGDIEEIIRKFSLREKPKTIAVKDPGVPTDTEASSREKKPMYEQDRDSEVARLKEKNTADRGDGEEAEWETPPEEIDFKELSASASPPKVDAFDDAPFWLVIPADSDVDFTFQEVRYTEFLSLTDVVGKTKVSADRIGLETLVAKFREATINANAVLDWKEDSSNKPYDLDANFDVKKFNLSEFFGALVPGEKPRVEGLFVMTAKADGDFPNLESARNHVKFLLDLESRKGVFRAIPPNSNLAQGSSAIAATAGQVLSWIPTGGVGLGALSRLVSYMREIPYELVSMHIKRETDLNVKVEKMEVRSEEMLISGRGGILYEEGVDLLNQKLDLTAEMDAVGEMAAILSGLGLLKDKRAENGYWHGFDFRIWGSLDEPKSNFDQIVTNAGSGALTRNITNPFHGIMGNIKHQGEKVKMPDDLSEEASESVDDSEK